MVRLQFYEVGITTVFRTIETAFLFTVTKTMFTDSTKILFETFSNLEINTECTVIVFFHPNSRAAVA